MLFRSKRVIVRNLAGLQTHGAELEDPQPWIDECVANNFWGLGVRWVKASESHDPSDVIATETRIITPAMAAQIDEAGNEVSPATAAVTEDWVQLKAEYTVEITDISYQTDLAACIAARIAEYPTAEDYLNSLFDGSPSLDDLKAKRLAVKAKYPKPVAAS